LPLGPECEGVLIVALPEKDAALNPCVPLNRGVLASTGEYVVLTNPEVVHRAPILQAMADELWVLGEKGYVAAACWSEKTKLWFCHSQGPKPEAMGRAKMPEGSGLHFCSMIFREFFDEIGGFSEEYRDGQGYEDNDFLWKLHAAGAQFAILDHLVTDHIDCPRTAWPKGGLERNRRIFETKWSERHDINRRFG
jgi:GT2 family glycosyltransferase